MTAEIATLNPNHPDAEVAKKFRTRVEEALVPVLEIVNEANKLGFQINFNLGPTYGGKIGITALVLSKQF